MVFELFAVPYCLEAHLSPQSEQPGGRMHLRTYATLCSHCGAKLKHLAMLAVLAQLVAYERDWTRSCCWQCGCEINEKNQNCLHSKKHWLRVRLQMQWLLAPHEEWHWQHNKEQKWSDAIHALFLANEDDAHL